MPIKETDLRSGDVIFFVNVYEQIIQSVDDDGVSIELQEYVDHVGMFVGYDEENNPRIVHSITGSKGYYHPEKASGLCMTTLRSLEKQEEEGRVYDVKYLVFRSAHSSIAAKALEILTQQSRFRIPYDEQRLQKKIALEATGMDGEEFKVMGEEAYRKSGIFRSIKYAARYPFLLTRTRGDGVGRGLTCSMSVILAFQIAELILDDKIIPNKPLLNQWPSDKYAAVSDGLISESYRAYLYGLRPSGTKERKRDGLTLSMTFWKGPQPPEEYHHKTFPVDCKCIGAEGMFHHMVGNQDAWELLGELDLVKRAVSLDDRVLDNKKKFIQPYIRYIQNLHRMETDISAPLKSPSPVFEEQPDLWWKKEDIISGALCSGLLDLNQEDLDELHEASSIRNSLAMITQQVIAEIPRVQLLSMLGMLLNTRSVRNVWITGSPMTQLPIFYLSQALCHQDITKVYQPDHLTKEGEGSAVPRIRFYSDQVSLYSIFTQIWFEKCIEMFKKEPEEEKYRLIKALTTKGEKLFKHGDYFDAISMYLSAQLAYCLLNHPSLDIHEAFLKLFLLTIKAFDMIRSTTPGMSQFAADRLVDEEKKLALLGKMLPIKHDTPSGPDDDGIAGKVCP